MADSRYTTYPYRRLRAYPGALHAFFNDTRPSYREEAAQDAWRRTLALFRRALV